MTLKNEVDVLVINTVHTVKKTNLVGGGKCSP